MKLPNIIKKSSAFTLIELLVVIAILATLMGLAIPAVAGAKLKGDQIGTLNNARQLQIGTFTVNQENEAAGVEGAWPSTTVTFAAWRDALLNVVSASDLKKMLSAPGVTVADGATATMANTAFNVYQVGNSEESTTIFLSTKNWSAVTPTTLPLAAALPYGDKGVIIMRKGGSGQVMQSRFLTDVKVLGLPNDTNPGLAQ